MKKILFGSADPLKNKEPSTSRLKPVSPTTSVSESNNITQSADYEPSISSSLNLNFQGLKFEVDPDEVQSPNSALWESLFGDQTDSCTDFMISSPKKTPDFMIYSPKRNTDSIIFSPPRRSPFGHAQGPSPLGSPSAAYNTVQKGKGQSPLHKVFPSTSEFGNVAGDGLGAYLTMKMTTGVGSPISEYLNVPMSSATMSNYAEPINQDKDIYQMNNFATLPLQQQQQDHSLLGLLSTESEQDNKDSGLELVHLLLACAEAVAKEDYMEARRYMHHLNSIVSPLGDSMQRVACCFVDALSARLAATLTITPNMISTPKPLPSNPLQQLNIYQILYQACPYIKFAHFTCNQAIFEAFEAEERVHIIDLDILQGYQWPAFMQALSSRYNGPPFLRITGVGYPVEAVRETGRCLAELADSLRIPFEFHSLGEQLEDLKPQMFQRRVGEALAVNLVNRLHRVPANQQGALLQMIRDQAPNIVTLVEQDASHNGPYFLGRFLEALHYYSAIFDSLDSTFTVDSVERAKVEQYIFALEIRNIVACEGAERVERHERLEKWKKLMEGAGFHGVPLSPNAVTQSEILLGLYACDSYRLTQDRGCLLLGWQDRVLISASAWRC